MPRVVKIIARAIIAPTTHSEVIEMNFVERYIKKIWDIGNLKFIYKRYGLSTTTVFLRTIFLSSISATFLTFIIYLLKSKGFIAGETEFKIDLSVILGLLAWFWTIYHSLHASFISKYSHLNSEIANLPADDFTQCASTDEDNFPKFHISNELLNFGDTCAMFNLTTHSDFKHIFDELIAHVMEIKDKHPIILEEIRFAFPKLHEALGGKSAVDTWKQLQRFMTHRDVWSKWEKSKSKK
jgi:hypothetical protein